MGRVSESAGEILLRRARPERQYHLSVMALAYGGRFRRRDPRNVISCKGRWVRNPGYSTL